MTLLMGDTTPRPWVFKHEAGSSVYEVRGDGGIIMHNEAYYPDAPTIADADLIVRAVNNHEALVAMVKELRQLVRVTGPLTTARERADKLLASIGE